MSVEHKSKSDSDEKGGIWGGKLKGANRYRFDLLGGKIVCHSLWLARDIFPRVFFIACA